MTTTPSGKLIGAPIVDRQQPPPWWYLLLAWLFPKRCREIPEADNPTWCEHRDPVVSGPTMHGTCRQCGAPPRIVLRQFAIIKRRFYLQQFACSEDPRFMHSHPARRMFVFGLWGGYTEHRIAGKPIERRAPYLYTMDGGHVHHVQNPGPGHTSLFLMLGLQHDDPIGDKRYYGAPLQVDDDFDGHDRPSTLWKPWKLHIRRKVARI